MDLFDAVKETPELQASYPCLDPEGPMILTVSKKRSEALSEGHVLIDLPESKPYMARGQIGLIGTFKFYPEPCFIALSENGQNVSLSCHVAEEDSNSQNLLNFLSCYRLQLYGRLINEKFSVDNIELTEDGLQSIRKSYPSMTNALLYRLMVQFSLMDCDVLDHYEVPCLKGLDLGELRVYDSIAQYPDMVQSWIRYQLARMENCSEHDPKFLDFLSQIIQINWEKEISNFIKLCAPYSSGKVGPDEEIYGQDNARQFIRQLFAYTFRRGHSPRQGIMYTGPHGVGKSLIADDFAKFFHDTVPCTLYCTPKLDSSWLCGSSSGCGVLLNHIITTRIAMTVVTFHDLDQASPDLQVFIAHMLESGRFTDEYMKAEIPTRGMLFQATCTHPDKLLPLLRQQFFTVKLAAYSPQQKYEMFFSHILPKALKNAHMPGDAICPEREALLRVIETYLTDPGARDLEQFAERLIMICDDIDSDVFPTITPQMLESLAAQCSFNLEQSSSLSAME